MIAMSGKRRNSRLIKLWCVVSVILNLIYLQALPAHAWVDGPTVQVSQVDMSQYPEVAVYVSVTDKDGRPVAGLSRADFQVTEDSVPVALTGFSGIGDRRLVDIVFVFDTTTSMVEEVTGMQRTSLAFTEKLRQSGFDYRLGLVDFGDVINRVELSDGRLTADVRQFEEWINAIQLVGGGHDIPELSLGAIQRAAQMPFRDGALKIFIVITDAPPHHYGDPPDASVSFENPNLTLDRTLERLAAANVTTYIIAPPDSDYVQIARETNGRLFDIHGRSDFVTIIDEIGGLISTQYRLTYRSPRPTYDGTRRDIRIEVGGSSSRATYLESHLLHIQSVPLVGLLYLLPLIGLLIAPLVWQARVARRKLRTGVESVHPVILGEPFQSFVARSCTRCGAALRPKAKFCAHCGQVVDEQLISSSSLTCPRCHRPMRSGARFCSSCGCRLSGN
jgi:Ca-activated chloride channel homolog